jgi:Tol biopolymer transport system component
VWVKLSLALVVALVLGNGATARTPASPWIVFSAAPDYATDGQHLYRARLDGSGLKQLTFGRGVTEQPAYSPDGSRIAYAGGGLFVINADGTSWRRLTANSCDHAPTWSRDGTKIAFIRCAHLYVVNADGKRAHRLFFAPAPIGRPSWDRPGRIFAAAASIPGGTQLVEISATSGRIKKRYRLHLDAPPELAAPTLSPNGKFVAYIDRRPCEQCRYEAYGLYVASVSGKSALLLEGGSATWSRNGKRLLYPDRGSFSIRTISTGAVSSVPGLPDSLIVSGPVAWQPR